MLAPNHACGQPLSLRMGKRSFMSVVSGWFSTPVLRSAPAEKARPLPVTTTARTEASADTSSIRLSRSSSVVGPTAFSFSGRFSVMIATSPSRSSRTASLLPMGRRLEA